MEHKPKECEKCLKPFTESDEGKVVERHQVWEIPEIKPIIEGHDFCKITCNNCGHETREPTPDWLSSGTGENLQAHIAYFTGEMGLSRRNVETVINEVFHIPLALGTIQNRLEDTSEILKPTCNELEEELVKQKSVNIDESSYPHNKILEWLWAFVATTFVFFTIQSSRGSKVLKQILGEKFNGIIICDRFSAYIKYQKDRIVGQLQFCWAHIIREVKAIQYELAYGSNTPFSNLFRKRIGAILRLWYCFKAGNIKRNELIEKVEPHIEKLRVFLENNLKSNSKIVAKFCKQLLKRWNSLFTFIYYEGVEPTNNYVSYCTSLVVLIKFLKLLLIKWQPFFLILDIKSTDGGSYKIFCRRLSYLYVLINPISPHLRKK